MAILFDFNGTMVFDEKYNKGAWRSYLEERIHRPVTDKDFADYIDGRNVGYTLEHFFQRKLTREEQLVLEEEKESLYRRLCRESGAFELAPGLEDFLNALKQQGVPMTIVTAAGLPNVKFFFESLNLERWFDMQKVVYNDGSCKGKPEPDMFLKAAANLGVSIKECFVFEDSKSGLEAGRRAGAKQVIRVLSNVNPIKGFECDREIRNYEDICYTDFF